MSPAATGAVNATSTSVPPLKSVPSLGPGLMNEITDRASRTALNPMKSQRLLMKSN
jgi:hypothetical protein